MLFEIILFPQHPAMEQPRARSDIEQQYPVGEYQELPDQHERKCQVDWITAEREGTRRDQPVGTFHVDADTKALSERKDAPPQQT